MVQYFSTILVVLSLFCQSLSSRASQTSSHITDNNTYSNILDNCIFNPIFVATSTEIEDGYASVLENFVHEKTKKELRLIKVVTFVGSLLFGNGFLRATTITGRIVYGFFTHEFFRTSYNCFLKNYCKIIHKQNAVGLDTDWKSKIAYGCKCTEILEQEEPQIEVLRYRTIQKKLQQMFGSVLLNDTQREEKRIEERVREEKMKEKVEEIEKGITEMGEELKHFLQRAINWFG